MREGIITVLLGLVMVSMIVITIILDIGKDDIAPTIRFDKEIEYAEGQDLSVLLEGVIATDEKDGDVSSAIIVESIVVLEGNEQARVVYYAKDKSNNVTKAERLVKYSGSGKSIFSMHANMEKEVVQLGEKEPIEIATTESYTESVDTVADSSEKNDEKEEKETTKSKETLSEETTEKSKEKVVEKDSEKNPEVKTEKVTEKTTEKVSENATEKVNPKSPVLTLTSNSATVHVGKNFNVTSMVKSITDDKDSRDDLYHRIGIEGRYDINTAGDYTFKIYCFDTERNVSNKETFTLHVID